MVAWTLAALLASVSASDVTGFEDGAMSLLQHRAQHNVGKLEHTSSGDLDFGKDVIERPFVDENKCDHGICPYEILDNSLGAMQGNGVITGVRFYAAKAGNFGLRFRVYRYIGNQYLYTGQTEEVPVPAVGINEYTFKEPLAFLYEDWVGFVHNGHGNIAYSEKQPGDGHVSWNSFNGWTQDPAPGEGRAGCGCYPFLQMGQAGYTTPSGGRDQDGFSRRTYSYSFTTRAPAKSDYNDLNLCSQPEPQDLPDFPPGQPAEEEDDAAAVGDPHVSTNAGKHFDLQ